MRFHSRAHGRRERRAVIGQLQARQRSRRNRRVGTCYARAMPPGTAEPPTEIVGPWDAMRWGEVSKLRALPEQGRPCQF
jgi:hypothetical protein